MDRKIYGYVWLIENYKVCYELLLGLKVENWCDFLFGGKVVDVKWCIKSLIIFDMIFIKREYVYF